MFSDSRCKNACKMLADLCSCFHQSPTRPNFGRSRVKVCPILCRLRSKLYPNFGCSRARLCPVSFAPCPFPNLAGTLKAYTLLNNYVEVTLVFYSLNYFPMVCVYLRLLYIHGQFRRYGRTCRTLWHGLSCRLR